MRITTKPFGIMPDGREISLYTLINRNGLKADIINYGGVIVSLTVPDRIGNMADILLGYDNLEDYLKKSPYFGALIGRHANRIEGASFTLNGIHYELDKNEGDNQLHGGFKGFARSVWDARILSDGENENLELSIFSPDGEEHYPGNLEVRVIYRLTDSNALEIEYFGVSDKDTVLNMTNHAYFNLSGHNSGTVLDHELTLDADFYTPINNKSIPTGEILSVKNTPLDFTQSKSLRQDLLNLDQYEQMRNGSGYDHNWVLKTTGDVPEKIGELYDPKSGRLMSILTTKPGIQIYSGNFLKSAGTGKDGVVYDKWYGLCLETQYFPNSMKHRHFPSPILKAGKPYHHTTIYKFSTGDGSCDS